MLFAILSRRPVIVLPFKEDTEAPLKISKLFNCCTVRFGFWASSNAAAPATCGVAIEVPLKNE